MTKDMFVWRKSIYDNKFKCNQCGAKLFNPKTNSPTDNLVVDADDADKIKNPKEPIVCFCGKCQNAVATWQPIESSDVDDGNVLQGNYSEWIERKAQDLSAEMQKRVEGRIAKKYEQTIKDLEQTIRNKDEVIKNLKTAHEVLIHEEDKKRYDLNKKLLHAESQIEKLQSKINEMTGGK